MCECESAGSIFERTRAWLCVFLIESPPGKLTGPRVAQPQISRIYISAGRLLEFSISALHVKGACVRKKKCAVSFLWIVEMIAGGYISLRSTQNYDIAVLLAIYFCFSFLWS